MLGIGTLMRGFASGGWAPSPAFTAAATAVQKLADSPSNEDKLKLYALFKQASMGKNTTPKPGMMDFVGKFKWQAWADLGELSQHAAEEEYIALCKKLGAGGASTAAPTSAGAYTTLEISQEGAVRTIMLARPEKRNAISITM